MGYPMTWQRALARNALEGDYDHRVKKPANWDHWSEEGQRAWQTQAMIAGDLRRLEADQRDEWHLSLYAKRAGVTPEQAKAVLDAFFASDLHKETLS